MKKKNINKDWPTERGIFHCKVDGKDMVLTHHYCELSMKHWWSTVDGKQVVGCNIIVGEKIIV